MKVKFNEQVFTAHFGYSNCKHEPNPLMKKIYENEFFNVRNHACALLNDHYDDWNAEFDRLYPGVNGEDNRYKEFIAIRQNEILKTLDDESIFIILRSSKTELGDIVAISKLDWRTTIDLSLKPI